MKYRKKPIIIEAIEFKDNIDFFEKLKRINVNQFEIRRGFNNCDEPILMIKTLEGDMIAQVGDYIIKGINGELYPCKPDTFKKTYEKV